MQETLLSQGVELMLYGMGTVFTFLALLVVLTTIMSALVQRFSAPEPVPVVKLANVPAASSAVDDGQLLAVITAAITQHRARHKS
ncbi:OadG family protein [bacterium]|nr:OadG family protein [bacterium]